MKALEAKRWGQATFVETLLGNGRENSILPFLSEISAVCLRPLTNTRESAGVGGIKRRTAEGPSAVRRLVVPVSFVLATVGVAMFAGTFELERGVLYVFFLQVVPQVVFQ